MLLNAGGSISLIAMYFAVFAIIIYIFMIRPDRRKRKEQEELFSAMKPGDTVVTKSGFYGIIIHIDTDLVIVEFGNNKNCRIPMTKEAIASIETPDLTASDE